MEQLKKIYENKPLFYGIIGGVIILLALFVTIGVANSSKDAKKGSTKVISEKVIKEPLDLLTTDNIGKAIEIQALLAREGIDASRKLDGTKSTIFLKQYTQSQKDAALLAIVKSGLMDQNVGLEIFDKGDFTSTKEDKRIRLARAINGELARLIRKIPPIENASVFISIPEQTMFTSMQKPVTATVQISIPAGDRLDQLKVKAITNLLLGSVTGLSAENIAITDTNGNVYSSIMDAEDEILEKLQENDKYMQQKVATQLDRLLGKGNYVVTVSTFLRQAPVEKFTIEYDPDKKTAVTEQNFSEGLGDQTRDANKNVNAVSVYLPNGLASGSSDSSQNRSYSRSATETQYGVTKVQTNEYIKAGVIEDISIAVTLEKAAIPVNTTLEELKELIAHAASPKVSAENVSIAFSDSADPYLASDKPVNLPKPDETGNPWWLTIAVSGIGLIILFKLISDRVKKVQEAQRKEVDQLRLKEAEQDRQLSDINSRAAQLTERQSELAQNLLEQQQRGYIPQQDEGQLLESLANVSAEVSDADEAEAAEKIKSWIEQG